MSDVVYLSWSEAPVAGHHMEVSIDDSHVTLKAVCEGEKDAQCRIACPKGCEEYPCGEYDDGTDVWREVNHGLSDAGHPEGECNITLFINESEEMGSDFDGPFGSVLATISFDAKWNGEFYQWTAEDVDQ